MIRQFDPVDTKPRALIEVKTSRTGEETPEAMVQFLSSLTSVKRRIMYMMRFGYPISFEVAVLDQRIRFFISVPEEFRAFIESQLIAQYPKVLINTVEDYLPGVFSPALSHDMGQMKLAYGFLYPLQNFRNFKDVDPFSSLLGVLSKAPFGDMASVQYLIVPVSNSWQKAGAKAAAKKPSADGKTDTSTSYGSAITEKIALNGFKTAIRIVTSSPTPVRAEHFMEEIANSFASYNNPAGNYLVLRRPFLWQKNRFVNAMLSRSKFFMPTRQILNVAEIASMYHFPTMNVANIPNISWYKTILSDPPENLPVAEGITEDEKGEINFFARTEFKNKATVFGLKKTDRRRHVYIIGKTGTGKSTLIANMAINDMRNNRGFCIIDPHGDLCETILNYVPSFRINDVIYLDPSDQEHAFAINPLEVKNPQQSELIVSGIVAIFRKLYDFSWGPRLEYILRNTLLSIINLPDATFLMIPDILTNSNFRKKVVGELTDPVLRNFWLNEFNTMPERMKAEALSPILNKVGQFLSAKAIRNIVKNPQSTIDLEKIMNEGKILLLNLSQGKLGEDNAALLGAMTITKFQLAAMGRVTMPEEQRRDFYLYVDEFQNFATSSFVKILSEARKYRLNLLMANQYTAQVPEDVRSAIFGNVGTMLSFLIGAEDTPIIAKEFSERFKEEDLLALGNHRAIIKLAIDGVTQSPFLCTTLPLPRSATQNKEKVIRNSMQRYTNLVTPDEPMKKFVPPGEEGANSEDRVDDFEKAWQASEEKAKANAAMMRPFSHKPKQTGEGGFRQNYQNGGFRKNPAGSTNPRPQYGPRTANPQTNQVQSPRPAPITNQASHQPSGENDKQKPAVSSQQTQEEQE